MPGGVPIAPAGPAAGRPAAATVPAPSPGGPAVTAVPEQGLFPCYKPARPGASCRVVGLLVITGALVWLPPTSALGRLRPPPRGPCSISLSRCCCRCPSPDCGVPRLRCHVPPRVRLRRPHLHCLLPPRPRPPLHTSPLHRYRGRLPNGNHAVREARPSSCRVCLPGSLLGWS